MRLKGINPVEQNIEKVFAGIFVVAILGVLALQFIGKPNRVKVGKDEVGLDEAYVQVAAEARKTDQLIKTPNPVNLPDAKGDEATKQIAQFNSRYNAAVAPAPQLAVALDQGAGIGAGATAAGDKGLTAVASVAIPAPTLPIGAPFMSEVDPIEIKYSADVATVLPAAAPFDKAAVTIETTFNGAALKAALMADPDGDGPIRAVPKSWWDGLMQILAVQAERETLKPDGTWAPAEPVKLMPGRLSLVAELDKLNSAMQLKDATRLATDSAEMIRRPPYFASRFGEPWAPPTEREAMLLAEGEKAAEIARLHKQLDVTKKARDAVQKNLGQVGQPPAPGAGGGGQRPGGTRPGGVGGGGGGQAPAPSGPSAADEARKRQLTQRLAALDSEIADIVAKLRALGEIVDDGHGNQGVVTTADKKATETPLLDNAAVRLWLHDVHVERGKTYRYRLTVALNNPYFGHSAAMPADQAALAKNGVIRSAPSEWSAAIPVDPETQIFFTSAQADDQETRAASAKAEVFRFRWGFWRKGQVSMTPGDAVVTEIRVPDFEKIVAGPAPDPNNPAAPAPGDAAPPGGGNKGGRPLGASPAGPGAAPGGGLGGGNAPAADAPAVPVPMVTFQVMDPTIMLGVAGASGAEQVVLRNPEGAVVTRTPEQERQAQAYKRVVSSAERGEKELRSKPKPRPDGPPGDRPNLTRPPRDDAPGPGGSG